MIYKMNLFKYKNHKAFMQEALKEAVKAYRKGEVPIGAVIVKNDKIISKAHNLKVATNDPTQHAELLAIKKATKVLGHWWLEDCILYTTLEPCAMCTGAILNARIDCVCIATSDPRMGACGGAIDLSNIDSFNHSFKIIQDIEKEKSRALLSGFFSNLRDKKRSR